MSERSGRMEITSTDLLASLAAECRKLVDASGLEDGPVCRDTGADGRSDMNYYNDNDPKACAWLRELIAAGCRGERQ